MANTVIPRQQGDAYQASFFWMNACKLYQSNTKVYKVEWEADSCYGFDDVVVHYDPAILDNGDAILVEKYQVKFHVDHQRGFSCEALIDPSFIGTKHESILGRLYAIYKESPEQSRKARYHIVNTWGMDSTDELRLLIGNGGAIRLEKLFDGTSDSSRFGKIRKMWREYLGIKSDDELKEVLRPLRIRHNYPDLSGIIGPLNQNLLLAGLKPIEADRRTSGYTELIQKLHAEGKTSFTREELHEICHREGLVEEKTQTKANNHVIGVRSFVKGAESLELEVNDLLCLLHYFSGRFMVEESSWQQVFPLVSDFADRALKSQRPIEIHLDTHLSIAFSFGYCLDFKYGVNVSVVQKTMRGKIIWGPDLDQLGKIADVWNFEESKIDPSANDLVLAISVTHDILHDVTQYVNSELNNASRIIHARIKPNPSNTAIVDANHIIVAVQELIRHVRSMRTQQEKTGRIHLFMAAPNAFAFFLGQQGRPLGKVTLYEFDFEQAKTGSYHPVISLPVNNI